MSEHEVATLKGLPKVVPTGWIGGHKSESFAPNLFTNPFRVGTCFVLDYPG